MSSQHASEDNYATQWRRAETATVSLARLLPVHIRAEMRFVSPFGREIFIVSVTDRILILVSGCTDHVSFSTTDTAVVQVATCPGWGLNERITMHFLHWTIIIPGHARQRSDLPPKVPAPNIWLLTSFHSE